jgi:KDO2-lipid IV(A) lauroyltransferase
MLLRLGLWLGDRLATALPSPAAYALADLAGRSWYRWSRRRRRLVAANLERVAAATGRPTSSRAIARLVRRAYVAHARYYLELVRAPHYDPRRVDQIMTAEGWDELEPIFRSGVVVATAHLGSFEPYGAFLGARGIRGVAPVQEIQPRELFQFLLTRRGARSTIELIPLTSSRRRLVAAARQGRVVALVADRDLDRDGVPVTLFGHATTLPAGPAFLALASGRPLLVARCLRVGRERFQGKAWPISVPEGASRGAAIRAMTVEMGRRFEEAIAEAPEQWWGAFQPIWPDLKP